MIRFAQSDNEIVFYMVKFIKNNNKQNNVIDMVIIQEDELYNIVNLL